MRIRKSLFALALIVALSLPGFSATLLTHTVKPSGGDYTTLAGAIAHLAASHANLVTADVYAEIEISGSWSSADTAAVDITGLTTDATHYLSIYTDTANRASMPWSTSKYNLSTTNAVALLIHVDYARVEGLQISVASATEGSKHIVYNTSQTLNACDLRLSKCVLRGHGSAEYVQHGIYGGANMGTGTLSVWDTVIYNIYAGSGRYGIVAGGSGVYSLYNSTVIGAYMAIYNEAGTFTAKNCYAGGVSGAAYYGTISMTTCASSDGYGSAGLQNIALGTDTFVAVAGGSEDYHLAADGLSPLENVGTDTSGTAAPLNFTVDMDGESFADDWDIGAFATVGEAEIVAPTVTTTAITSILGTSATSGGTVTDTGGEAVTDQGVCWSTSANPIITDSHTHDVADPSPFASSITSLTANTVYHVRAYATNSAGTGYG